MSKRSVSDVSVNGVDVAGARTVVNVADHMMTLRDAAKHLQSTFDTRDRGYFSPSEDEQVEMTRDMVVCGLYEVLQPGLERGN